MDSSAQDLQARPLLELQRPLSDRWREIGAYVLFRVPSPILQAHLSEVVDLVEMALVEMAQADSDEGISAGRGFHQHGVSMQTQQQTPLQLPPRLSTYA